MRRSLVRPRFLVRRLEARPSEARPFARSSSSTTAYLAACWLSIASVTLIAGANAGADRSKGNAGEPWPRVATESANSERALRGALTGAAQWLNRQECRAVFTDFKDVNQNSLRTKLEALGVDEATYLGLLLFRDGSGMSQCQRPQTVMFTSPGHRVIFVCERRVVELWRFDRTVLQAMVIHEALHALGLGENPPTSAEITSRVLERCRR
jgi:hypothetical protein